MGDLSVYLPDDEAPPTDTASIDEVRAYVVRKAGQIKSLLRATAGFYWDLGSALGHIQRQMEEENFRSRLPRKQRPQFGKFLRSVGKEVGFSNRSLYNAMQVARHFPTREAAEAFTVKRAIEETRREGEAKGLIYSREYPQPKPKPKPKAPVPTPPAPQDQSQGITVGILAASPNGHHQPPELDQVEGIEPPDDVEALNATLHHLLARASHITSRKGLDVGSIERLLMLVQSLPE